MKLLLIASYLIALGLWLVFCKFTKRPDPSARALKIFTALYAVTLVISFFGYGYLTTDLPDDDLAIWEVFLYCCLVALGIYAYIRFKWKMQLPKD